VARCSSDVLPSLYDAILNLYNDDLDHSGALRPWRSAVISSARMSPSALESDERAHRAAAQGGRLRADGRRMRTRIGIRITADPALGNAHANPMQYREFSKSAEARRRYWARGVRLSSVAPTPKAAHRAT